MLTTPQIVTLVRKKMLEETEEIVEDSTLLLYGNLTQEDIGIRTMPSTAIKTAQIVFTAGVGALPSDFGTPYGDALQNGAGGNVHPFLSIADFARTNTGYAVTIEDGEILAYPATNKTLTVRYYPTYATLSESQNPTIDPYFHELLIYGILYRAYEDLQDEELSKYYRNKYEDEFKIKRNAKTNYEEQSNRGGEMFNGIQIVSDNSGGFSGNPSLM